MKCPFAVPDFDITDCGTPGRTRDEASAGGAGGRGTEASPPLPGAALPRERVVWANFATDSIQKMAKAGSRLGARCHVKGGLSGWGIRPGTSKLNSVVRSPSLNPLTVLMVGLLGFGFCS